MKKNTKKVVLKKGDWMRVCRGPLEGAEGSVSKIELVSKKVTVIEIRQLNGNIIRLPRPHFEFAAYRGTAVDSLCG